MVADTRDETGINIFLRALDRGEVRNLDFFITLAWEIWNVRNNMVAGGGGWDSSELIRWTGDFLAEYKRANTVTRVESGSLVVAAWPP
jgi:hypothetical protein